MCFDFTKIVLLGFVQTLITFEDYMKKFAGQDKDPMVHCIFFFFCFFGLLVRPAGSWHIQRFLFVLTLLLFYIYKFFLF